MKENACRFRSDAWPRRVGTARRMWKSPRIPRRPSWLEPWNSWQSLHLQLSWCLAFVLAVVPCFERFYIRQGIPFLCYFERCCIKVQGYYSVVGVAAVFEKCLVLLFVFTFLWAGGSSSKQFWGPHEVNVDQLVVNHQTSRFVFGYSKIFLD